MFRKPTAAARHIDALEEGYILETERLALLHQVESRIRARSEAKKHSRTTTLDSEGNLEGQIAELLVAKDSHAKERGNIASKIRNVRNLIEDASSQEIRDFQERLK
jgi:hypothetical protein